MIQGDVSLNDTGITSFYNDGGVYENTPNSNYPKQDASFGYDIETNPDFDGYSAFSFTKLDSSGNALPSSETSFECVQDNRTGLVWEVKGLPQVLPTSRGAQLRDLISSSIRGSGYPYYEANEVYNASNYKYYWYNSEGSNNGGFEGVTGSTFVNNAYPISTDCAYPIFEAVNHVGNSARNCSTQSHIDAFNSLSICGKKNWRLPSLEELRSLQSYQSGEDNEEFFPNTANGEYLSSNPSAGSTGAAWCYSVTTSRVQLCNKQIPNHIRLVRGGIEE